MKTLIFLVFLFLVLSFPMYAQQAINYGETITGSISADGEVDVFTFTGVENEKVIIRLTENSSSYPLEPLLELFDPLGSLVKSISDGSQAQINIILPQTGTYTIFTSDANGDDTGSYALFIQRMINPGNTTIINYGETLAGSIATDGEVDTYSFAGEEGDKIILRLTENSSSYPLEPLLELFDPAGDSLIASINLAQAQVEITLPANGSYTILTSDAYPGDDTGSYALFIQQMINPGNTTIINYGETLAGSIATDGEVDTYTFAGEEGDKIILRLTENSSSYPLEPLLELFDPAGDSLIASINLAQAQVEITLPANGSYTILTSDAYPGDDTGSYALFIQQMINPGNTTIINYGETVAGSIATDGEVDTYTFAGEEGDKIILRLTENSSSYPLEPLVELFDPAGDSLITSIDLAQAQVEITLPANGSYTILTSDAYPGDDTGNYALFMQRLVKPAHRTKIKFGETLTGSISTDGEVDTYSFLGAPGDSVIIRLTENSNSYPLEPLVELFDPSGDLALAVSADAQAEIGIRLKDVGYYTILTSDSYPGDDTGNYTIFLFGFMSSQIVALPEFIDFGDVIVNQTASDSVLLFNRGTITATNSMTISGENRSNFIVNPAFSTLDAGDSQFVSLEFIPDAIDTFSAGIIITSTGGEAAVNLRGTGIADPTSIEDFVGSKTTEFQLYQNYPNPFNPTTSIRYSIPVAGMVNITVMDILGREVATLINEYKNAGVHRIDFYGSRYASGIYFYRIQSGAYTQIRKMVLTK